MSTTSWSSERMTGAPLTDFRFSAAARRRLRALVGHVIGFWTWRSLVVEQGLSIREASGLAADVVLAVATDA
jgi:hypothetical protein